MEKNIIKSTIKEFENRSKYLDNFYKLNRSNVEKNHELLSEIQQIDAMILKLKELI